VRPEDDDDVDDGLPVLLLLLLLLEMSGGGLVEETADEVTETVDVGVEGEEVAATLLEVADNVTLAALDEGTTGADVAVAVEETEEETEAALEVATGVEDDMTEDDTAVAGEEEVGVVAEADEVTRADEDVTAAAADELTGTLLLEDTVEGAAFTPEPVTAKEKVAVVAALLYNVT